MYIKRIVPGKGQFTLESANIKLSKHWYLENDILKFDVPLLTLMHCLSNFQSLTLSESKKLGTCKNTLVTLKQKPIASLHVYLEGTMLELYLGTLFARSNYS